MVAALATHGDAIVAGGRFDTAGGIAAANIAEYRAGEWRALGTGIAGEPDPHVGALTEFGGDLVAAGQFSVAGGVRAQGVARWDGVRWWPLGGGISGGAVTSLAVYRGNLIAAGALTSAGGLPAHGIARWDGASWHALGQGLTLAGPWARVHLTVYEDDLLAVGDFTGAGPLQVGGMALWNGEEWRPFPVAPPVQGLAVGLRRATIFKGELLVAGSVNDCSWGGLGDYAFFGVWDGFSWRLIGRFSGGCVIGSGPPAASALATFDGLLYTAVSQCIYMGPCSSSLWQWDGARWLALPRFEPGLSALVATAQGLTAGGTFTQAGGVPASNIAEWSCAVCRPDCDTTTGPGVLDIFDFLCFQNRYDVRAPYACDFDTSTGLGVCDAFDFLEFQNAFAAGCP